MHVYMYARPVAKAHSEPVFWEEEPQRPAPRERHCDRRHRLHTSRDVQVVRRLSFRITSLPRRILDMHEEGMSEWTCTSQGLRCLGCAYPFCALARSSRRLPCNYSTESGRVVERRHNVVVQGKNRIVFIVKMVKQKEKNTMIT